MYCFGTVDHGANGVSREFPGTEASVSEALADLRHLLIERGYCEEVCANALIVLGEVLNNIVEHALPEIPDAVISLNVMEAGRRLMLETCDSGRPLPPNLMQAPNQPVISDRIDDMAEGGFGWFIIHSLVEDMVYEREDGQNRLSFSVMSDATV
ncbi:ATP-binding protein [Jannaschia pohangensis]|uniref:Serine/threonine-protein kinase RsbW n=1 Tax=Jannaschia pohangensis TaxID=390807 RepID=A0A1I3NRR4_9RHOB|nr:ATP-binding protein [Jannaschia pohangensis]SFJ11998.1 serine/threonine-protein kinase RsbW [Jannaschia pohangensis]